MNSVAPAAAEQPPIFHADPQRTALEEAVAPALGEQMVSEGFIVVPSFLEGFRQTDMPRESTSLVDFGTKGKPAKSSVTTRVMPGEVAGEDAAPMICDHCGGQMVGHGTHTITLWHLPMGMDRTRVEAGRRCWMCSCCGRTHTAEVPFKAEHHRVTVPLMHYVWDLLTLGLTLKEVSQVTGLHQATVKSIDEARLRSIYTEVGEDGARRLRRPERQARFLGIDESELHNGHRYATVIIDLETGHVLWLAHSKKKKVVHDFCDFVGDERVSGVVAIACDTDADYERALEERHPHLDIVYDHFHLVKNLNEKVISAVRKDEQRRLVEEGDEEAARSLKGSKYILMTKSETRATKDGDARAGKVISRGDELSDKEEVTQRGGCRERYKKLIKENELLATCDLVKEMLAKAYTYKQPKRMRDLMEEIVAVCKGTGNEHFLWFARLVEGHMEGIVAHAKHRISSGRVEGTNGMIKQLRRTGYGYPDDQYFFLKIFDASRRGTNVGRYSE